MVQRGQSPQTSFLSAIELDDAGVDYKTYGNLAASGELTINQALDYSASERTGKAVKSKIRSLKKKLVDAGVSLDTPFSSLDKVEMIQNLAKKWRYKDKKGNWKYPENSWTELKAIEGSLERLWAISDQEGSYAKTGLKTRIETTLGKEFGGVQKRLSKKLLQVPEAKISLPLITQAIAGIKDADTRHAVAVNAIIPFRPNEIASLTLEDYDPASGKISEWTRKTKKRNALTVPELVKNILNSQVEKLEKELSKKYYIVDGNEEPEGRTPVSREEFEEIKRKTPIFNTSVNKMSQAITAKGGLKDLMKPFEKDMGRSIRGISDLRKIIPTILAKELGMSGTISKLMGHSEDATFGEIMSSDLMKKMTAQHYVGDIIGGPDSSLYTLRGLENVYANKLGVGNLNSVGVLMNLDIPTLGIVRLADGTIKLDNTKPVIDALPENSEFKDLADMDKRMVRTVGEVDFELARQNANASLKLALEKIYLDETETKLERVKKQKELNDFLRNNSFRSLDPELDSVGVIKRTSSPVKEYANITEAAEKNENFAKLLKALNLKPVQKTLIAAAGAIPIIGTVFEGKAAHDTLTTPEEEFVDPNTFSKIGRAVTDVVDPALGVTGQALFPKKDDPLQQAAGAVAEPFVQAEQGFIKKALSQINTN
tara:strand:+ start:44 stop:2008 length:1965 start_codon:yes stop_codon:yes gene_type:complete